MENVNRHVTEEQLVWHYYGEENSAETELHLGICRPCRAAFEQLKAEMASVNALSVPEPEGGYEDRLWRSLVRRDASLARRAPWWRRAFAPARLAWMAGLACLMIAAFIAGRASRNPDAGGVDPAVARERLLVAALAEHLEQSERILLEIDKLELRGEAARAESLLAANRLYRQTAARQGKASLAATLDDLERVLLDVARSPGALPADQLRGLQARVAGQNLLFQVRMLGSRLRQMEDEPLRPSAAEKSTKG